MVTVGARASLYWTATPPAGASEETSGVARMVKSASLTSKKTLPTASILIRALSVATFGTVTVALPLLAVALGEHVREGLTAVGGEGDPHLAGVDRSHVGAGDIPGHRLRRAAVEDGRRRPAR